MANAVKITDSTFEKEIVKSDIPAIVDFWAEWCAPCKLMAPVFDEVAGEFEGKIKFGKIDVDDNTRAATELGVMNIPTLVFFKGGKEAGRSMGALSKRDLIKKISELFNV